MSLLLARRRPLLFPSAAAAGYADEVLADDPLGYWQFEETSGSTASDSSDGTTYDGTIVGATIGEAGQVGNAFSFDGTDDYVSYGTDLWDASSGTALTVEAIIKTTDTAGMIMAADVGSATVDQRSWLFLTSAGGLLRFVKIPNTVEDVFGTTNVADNAWHHVAATYDGTRLRVYVDGVEDGDAAASGSMKGSIEADIRTGISGRTNSNPYAGTIDEPAIYTSVLTPARILAHAEAAGVA